MKESSNRNESNRIYHGTFPRTAAFDVMAARIRPQNKNEKNSAAD
jgi:hypothetical protein